MMTTSYAYTPYIWPSILTVILLIALAAYSGRRRSVPGATPFTIACLFGAAWAAGSVMEYAASDLATKIAWVKFQAICELPLVIAITCFILEYAWPGRWLTRWVLTLLAFTWLLEIGLILTNELHHWVWRDFGFDGSILTRPGPVSWLLIAYGIGILGTLDLIVLGWLFLHSPQHRWPVALLLTGHMGGRILFLLERANLLRSPLPLDLLGMAFEFLMYTCALFGFRILDPITLARRTVIAQMPEGMLVLDTQGKIVSLNPAARVILSKPKKQLIGRSIQDLLPVYPNPQDGRLDEAEINLGAGPESRQYLLEASVLKDWRGLEVGRLLLLHDVTAQKQAQAQLLEQQRALAILTERERLARELHDGLGQALAAAHLQASTAKLLLARGEAAQVDECLDNLAAATLQAEADMREYLLGVKTVISADRPFIATLQEYLVRFTRQYGLPVELSVPSELEERGLAQTVEVQLLRIIQEALSNARKHARAGCIRVTFTLSGDWMRVVVSDDGQGFDPAVVAFQLGRGFGLQAMRARAEALGGRLEVISQPGQGTQVVVQVPMKAE